MTADHRSDESLSPELAASPAPGKRPLWVRLAPLLVILGGLAAVWASGLYHYLSFDSLRQHRLALEAFVRSHHFLAIFLFAALYALATTLALPGALWLTIGGGFLFGVFTGSAAVLAGATAGACALFMLARTALGGVLAARAGPFLRKMEKGFQEDQAFYLLTIRLVPIVPFFVSNIAPALLGARLRTFAWTTLLGITPSVIAYTWIGAGLGGLMDQGGAPDLAHVFQQIAPPLVAIGVLPLIAVAVKHFRGDRSAKAAASSLEPVSEAAAK